MFEENEIAVRKGLQPLQFQSLKFKVGLFGIGLEAYWAQFEGLKERLEGYLGQVETQLRSYHPEVFNLGMIDTIDKAFDAGTAFRTADVDIIFLYVSTYALSATVFPVIRKANVPVIVLNLAPEQAIDYESFNAMQDRVKQTGTWLAYCSSCSVPELANVFQRANLKFHQVTGLLDPEDACWVEVETWIQAARVARVLQFNRMGCMGHYYSGMMDIYTDCTRQLGAFGGHMELLEVEELAALREAVNLDEIAARLKLFDALFDIQEDCLAEDLEMAARTSVALDQMAAKYKLGSIAYYYKGTGNAANEEAISSIILGNSLLTARGIPVAGEYEIKNVQAMKIMDAFGAGGSFSEFYAMDYKDDVVLLGHDGPGHIRIAEGKIKVRPLRVYHGKVGSGLSIEMMVKNGPVTLLSVVEKDAGLLLLVAEGHSVAGPILEIGNTNSRYKFEGGIRNFVRAWNSHGPAHHCAIGIGHLAHKIKKLGAILDIPVVQVC
jgi:L-arabinose isomerase